MSDDAADAAARKRRAEFIDIVERSIRNPMTEQEYEEAWAKHIASQPPLIPIR